jgi:HK97 family phage portal protein
MFDFLFQNKNGEIESLLDLISVNLTKIQAAGFAYEKAVSMIAKAIARSEIIVLKNNEKVHDDTYYRLNIRPNDNQSGTDFWYMAVSRLLETGDCLIVRLSQSGMYYIADSYTTNNWVVYEKAYSNVVLTDGADTWASPYTFQASQVIHLKYTSDKLRMFTKNVLDCYNDTLSALNTLERIANTPFFKYKTDSNAAFHDKVTGKKLTIDAMLDKLKTQLESKDITIISEQAGTELKFLDMNVKVTASEVRAIADEINTMAAQAFDIPLEIFTGDVDKNSDAVNNFVTFAVEGVAEVINDSLNAALVGQQDYIKGERVYIWLARFKHADVLDAATKLDKLRGIGFTLDEIFEMVGYPALNTEFSTSRALTLNYSTDLAENSDDSDGKEAVDEPKQASNQKLSKHKERRLRRNA